MTTRPLITAAIVAVAALTPTALAARSDAAPAHRDAPPSAVVR